MGLFKKYKNSEMVSVDDVLLQALINGDSITKDMALSIPAVAKAVEKISNTFATIPFYLYRENVNADGKRKSERIDDIRVSLINDDTFDTLDGFQFKKQIVNDYLLGKGGYAYINKRGNKVISVNYVDEAKIVIQKNSDAIFKRILLTVDGQSFEDYEFLKIMRATTDGGSGRKLIDQIQMALQTTFAMLKYQLNLVKTGGNKRGFVTSARKLDKEAIDALKEAWRKLYSDSTENVVVLNDGLNFKEASNTSLEMQLNESKTALTREIDDIFGISEDDEKFFKYAIFPIIKAFESALNRDFLLESEKGDGFYWAADLSEITKEDILKRYQAYHLAISDGWQSPNEIRYKENEDAIDGLDIINMNLGSVVFDIKTGKFYVPNTGKTISLNSKNDGGGE